MGTALPSQRTFPSLALKQKMLMLNQANSDNVIRKSDMGESELVERGVHVPVRDCHELEGSKYMVPNELFPIE